MAESGSTKTKIKPGVIELDPVESVVIVNYEKQTLDVSGPEPVVLEKEKSSKRYSGGAGHGIVWLCVCMCALWGLEWMGAGHGTWGARVVSMYLLVDESNVSLCNTPPPRTALHKQTCDVPSLVPS
jgi:hypothetical protein